MITRRTFPVYLWPNWFPSRNKYTHTGTVKDSLEVLSAQQQRGCFSLECWKLVRSSNKALSNLWRVPVELLCYSVSKTKVSYCCSAERHWDGALEKSHPFGTVEENLTRVLHRELQKVVLHQTTSTKRPQDRTDNRERRGRSQFSSHVTIRSHISSNGVAKCHQFNTGHTNKDTADTANKNSKIAKLVEWEPASVSSVSQHAGLQDLSRTHCCVIVRRHKCDRHFTSAHYSPRSCCRPSPLCDNPLFLLTDSISPCLPPSPLFLH